MFFLQVKPALLPAAGRAQTFRQLGRGDLNAALIKQQNRKLRHGDVGLLFHMSNDESAMSTQLTTAPGTAEARGSDRARLFITRLKTHRR